MEEKRGGADPPLFIIKWKDYLLYQNCQTEYNFSYGG